MSMQVRDSDNGEPRAAVPWEIVPSRDFHGSGGGWRLAVVGSDGNTRACPCGGWLRFAPVLVRKIWWKVGS